MLDWVAAHADKIMAMTNFVFIVALVPTAWYQWRLKASTVPLYTSLLTTAALIVFVVAFLSLRMWLTFAAESVVVALWAIIAGQRFVYGSPKGGALCGRCGRVFELPGWQRRDGACDDGRYYCPDCITGHCGCGTLED